MLRPWPAQVHRVLEALARKHRVVPDVLIARIGQQPHAYVEEHNALLSAATISHTSFFRHAEQLAFFRQRALPDRYAKVARPVRVWCAACSTGEEAWSLAICADLAAVPCEITATDVDPVSIAHAQRAEYRADRAEGIPSSHRGSRNASWQPDAKLRQRVRFVSRSLLDGAPPRMGGYDFVFCRNVLIYFSFEEGVQIVKALQDAVAPDGALVLSPVEALLRVPGRCPPDLPLGWLCEIQDRAVSTPAARHAPPSPPRRSATTPEVVVQAAQLLGTEMCDQAESLLMGHLDAQPQDAEAWFLLGEALLARGQRVQARIAFGKAAECAQSGGRTGLMAPHTMAAAATRRAAQLE